MGEVRFKHRSVSQYTTFVRCGEQYRLTKIEQAPQTPAAWFFQGIAFHVAIEAWEKSLRELPDEMVTQLYVSEYRKQETRAKGVEPDVSKWLTGGRVKPENDVVRRLERGEAQVKDYMAWARSKADEWRIWQFLPGEAACELPFSLHFGDVEVIGSIDQVVEFRDGTLRPRDLKTGTKLPDTAFQLAVYDFALEELFGFKCQWGDFYMAKNTDATDPRDLSYYTRERLTRWFENMDRAVRLGIFLPNPGDVCRTCGVRRYCDAGGGDSDEYAPQRDKELNN